MGLYLVGASVSPCESILLKTKQSHRVLPNSGNEGLIKTGQDNSHAEAANEFRIAGRKLHHFSYRDDSTPSSGARATC